MYNVQEQYSDETALLSSAFQTIFHIHEVALALLSKSWIHYYPMWVYPSRNNVATRSIKNAEFNARLVLLMMLNSFKRCVHSLLQRNCVTYGLFINHSSTHHTAPQVHLLVVLQCSSWSRDGNMTSGTYRNTDSVEDEQIFSQPRIFSSSPPKFVKMYK